MASLTPAIACCPGLAFPWLLVLSCMVAPLLDMHCAHKPQSGSCLFSLLLSPESGTPEGNVPGGEHFSHAPKTSSPHGNVLSSCTALLGAAKKWDKRQGAENDAQGIPPEREEELFCVSGWALEQAAQRCCWSLLHWRDSGIVWM